MATAGSIVVDLLMRTGSFETDSKRAERRMKEMSKEIDKTVKSLKSFALGAIGVGSFAAAIKQANSYMAEMGNAAQRTSIATAAFTELNFAAERASLSQGELERVLRRSTEAINHGAKGGSKQAEALKTLGISAYDAAGNLKTADVMLRDMAEQFSKLEPGARKTGLVIDLFGQQLGQKVIPLLNQGAAGLDEMAKEASRLGLVIDDEAAQAASDFEDNLDGLKKSLQGVAITIAQDLVPMMSRLSEEFQSGMANATGFFDAIVKYGLSNPFKSNTEHYEGYSAELKKLRSEMEALDKASGSYRWRKDRVDYIEPMVRHYERLARRDFEGDFVGAHLPPATKTMPAINVSGVGGGKKTTKAKTEIDAGQRLIDQMNERLALLGKETEYEKLMAQLAVKSVEFRTEAQQKEALAIAQSLDGKRQEIEHEQTLKDLRAQQSVTQEKFMRELAAFGQGDWARGVADALNSVEDKYQKIIEDRRNSPMGLSDAQLSAIQKSLNEELEMTRQHYETLKALRGDWQLGAKDALTNYADETADVYSSMGRTVSSAFDGMGDAISSMVKSGKLDFSSLADSIISDLIRISVQQSILGPIAGALGGMFGGGGLTGVRVPGFSDGGFTGIGGRYEPAGIVHKGEGVLSQDEIRKLGGESGFNALRRAISGPGHASGGMAGRPALPQLMGVSAQRPQINITVNVSGDGVSASAPSGWESMADDIGRFVDAKFKEHEMQSQRAGGLAWRARQGY